jgi:hypothetical protein
MHTDDRVARAPTDRKCLRVIFVFRGAFDTPFCAILLLTIHEPCVALKNAAAIGFARPLVSSL